MHFGRLLIRCQRLLTLKKFEPVFIRNVSVMISSFVGQRHHQNSANWKTNCFCLQRTGSLSLMKIASIVFSVKVDRHFCKIRNLASEYASAQDLFINRCFPIAESHSISWFCLHFLPGCLRMGKVWLRIVLGMCCLTLSPNRWDVLPT